MGSSVWAVGRSLKASRCAAGAPSGPLEVVKIPTDNIGGSETNRTRLQYRLALRSLTKSPPPRLFCGVGTRGSLAVGNSRGAMPPGKGLPFAGVDFGRLSDPPIACVVRTLHSTVVLSVYPSGLSRPPSLRGGGGEKRLERPAASLALKLAGKAHE